MRLAILLLAALCAGAAQAAPAGGTPDLSGNDPHWIKDGRSGCWAGDPDPQPGESIVWEGACENDLVSGEGTLTWYRNGRISGRDIGTFKNGILSGQGTVMDVNGAVYVGAFPGAGILTLPDGMRVKARTERAVAGWSIVRAGP